MPFTCKSPHGDCSGKLKLRDTRHVYDNAKLCSTCTMYVDSTNKRCPCCNAPLRTKSKRSRQYRGVF